MSTEVRQVGRSAQDPSRKTMAPWTFDMEFPLGTQFTFGSLTFARGGGDGDLKMLPPGPTPGYPTPTHSSTSGGPCSGLDPFAGLYIRTVKLVQGIPIVTSTLWSFTRAPSSSSSASSPSRDSSDDYPKIGASAYGNFVEDSRLILMVAPNGDQSCNNSVDIPLLEDQRRLMPKLLKLGWFGI
jgi:hypothetical protein